MANYVYIDNLEKKGHLGISRFAFDSVITSAIDRIEGISKSQKKLKKDQRFLLNRPVRTSIHNGIVHVHLMIDIRKELDENKTLQDLNNQIHLVLAAVTEQVPYDIDIKIVNRI